MMDDFDEYLRDYDGRSNEEKLERFKIIARQVNWDQEDSRQAFFYNLWRLSIGWSASLPDLRDYFQENQVDWLLEEIVESNRGGVKYDSLLEFIIETGYRDQPELDEYGQASPLHTTPIHRLAKLGYMDRYLFRIFDDFEVNYVDENGYTHLHVACQYGYRQIVERFLVAGHDPNFVDRSTGNTPLLSHLSNVKRADPAIVQLLLLNGADPNAANAEGTTALHLIATGLGYPRNNEHMVDLFFRINYERRRDVRIIDARDSRDRSPLECAVERLDAAVVDALLARGANTADLVFPSEAHFDEFLGSNGAGFGHGRKLLYASAMLSIVERLRRAGYELNRSQATTVMKLFVQHGFNDKSSSSSTNFELDLKDLFSGQDEARFSQGLERMIVRPNLSFHDMIVMLRDGSEPEEPLEFRDYYKFALWHAPWYGCSAQEAAVTRLCERMARKFFLKWALEPFVELRPRLPVLCCEMVLGKLKNDDLYNVCVAAEGLA